MKVLARRFNIYLALAFLLGPVCGCQTGKPEKEAGALRVHIEVSPDPAGTSQDISVLRSNPVLVTIKREPILTEANIVSAKVIDARGGFAIEINFDENGAWLLEQYSAANPGGHFVIWSQWSENDYSPFSANDIVDLPALSGKLKQPADAVSLYLKSRFVRGNAGTTGGLPRDKLQPNPAANGTRGGP